MTAVSVFRAKGAGNRLILNMCLPPVGGPFRLEFALQVKAPLGDAELRDTPRPRCAWQPRRRHNAGPGEDGSC